jgi:lipid A 4'-phosphatase
MRRLGLPQIWLPSGRAVLFLAMSLALGPGLLVNLVLKEHSHRPRPVQTQEMGGKWEFRPWYRFDGQCERNCSFVSGEAASGFWTLAPALLTPPPVRPVAVAVALTFGAATGALRMAFGGHYLSDVLFAGLFTLLIILGLYRFLIGPERKESDLRDTDAAL